MTIEATAADMAAATAAATAAGVTLESIAANLAADGYEPAGVQANAPIYLRRWIETTARNYAVARHNATVAAAPRERMGCDACGDDVPARLTPRGYLCQDCRRGSRE